MRLADMLAGTRAIKRVVLPLINIPETAEQLSVEVGLRAFTGAEWATVLERAHRFAVEHGVDKPEEGNPIYDHARAVYTCAVACVDPDSDPLHPRRFFDPPDGDGTVEAAARYLLDSPHIGRDAIVYLYEQQEAYQDLVNPQLSKPTLDEVLVIAEKALEDNDVSPFLALRPGARLSCLALLGSLALSSRLSRSEPGSLSSSEPETNGGSSSTQQPPASSYAGSE